METNSVSPSIHYLDEETAEEIKNDFKGQKLGWVLVGEKKWFLPAKYEKQSTIYNNFEVKSDDVWVITFPRSGTTLTQEMVWLLNNNLDFSAANTTDLGKRCPYVEHSILLNDYITENIINENCIETGKEKNTALSNIELSYKNAQSISTLRVVKTHFPLSLFSKPLETKCKIIYVARNPKDVAVSFFHFQKNLKLYDYQGDFEKYWNYFQNNQIFYGPYWEHVKEAWAQRENPNFLFLFYEDIIHDLLAVIKKVAAFLNKSYTDEQYRQLAEHLQFSNFKKNKMVNLTQNEAKIFFKTDEDTFIRQGKSEAWHSMFSPKLNDQANRWIENNFKNTDLKFPHINIYS